MNIFSSMLGSIAGLFESAKANIAGFFGYDEASEEVAAELETQADIDDAELDNLQEADTHFVETIYTPFEELAVPDEEEKIPETTAENFNPYNEHPEGLEGWFVEQETVAEKTETPLPTFEPDDTEEITDDETEEPDEPQFDIKPISQETWAGWDEPEAEFNPDNASVDELLIRIEIAQSYGLDENEFIELYDSELTAITATIGRTIQAGQIEDIDDFMEAYFEGNKNASIRLLTPNIQDAIDYMGAHWQFHEIMIVYDEETDSNQYMVVYVGTETA